MSDDGVILGQARSVEDLTRRIDPDKPPTPEQAAVIGGGLEPTLVVAGAGSGKTETLSLRMVYLLDHGEELFGRPISPDEILCLTFTRKAAAEIAERSERRIATVFGRDPARPAASVATYNGYSASLVAEHGLRVGVDPDSVTLTDAALWQIAVDLADGWTAPVEVDAAVSTVTDAIPRLAQQLSDHQLTPARLRSWATGLLADLEALPKKDGDAVPGSLVTRSGAPTALGGKVTKLRSLVALADMVERFQERKRELGAIDFSDQVAVAVQLAELEGVQAIERSRYRAVLLDEFQDTSPGQLQLFARVFGAGHPVMAVGDPHQAIYGFRGASASALSAFVERFGQDRVSQRSLSVSWRNETPVLDVANAAAEPLRDGSAVHVEPLRSTAQYLGRAPIARPAPGVQAHMAVDLADEASTVVRFLAERRAELAADREPGDPVTAAVLCRRRVQFEHIVAALEAAGEDYEVVGLGGLLDTPEVADLVALLEVAHDPSRGDSLMRLLASERLAIGPRDLMALSDWAQHLSGPRGAEQEAVSIVDALADLPRAEWVSDRGRALTAAARERLRGLQAVIAAIRSHTYLPLTELVVFAERAWGLDIEAAVARPDGVAERNVDAFVDAARGFAAGAEHATLGALLQWLDAARREERGLTAPVKDPEPGAIQVLTVHAAKGLEWDVVAVPGMTQGQRSSQFPKVDPPTDKEPYFKDGAWLSETGALPYELRLDAADLPWWDRSDVVDHASLSASIAQFRRDCGAHQVDEERRLFYVAVTRARSHVLLSGSWWNQTTTAAQPSLFVRELLDAGLVSRDGWAEEPEPDADPPEQEVASAVWPREVTPAQAARRALAERVVAARESLTGDEDPVAEGLPLGREVTAMLAERAARSRAVEAVALPTHLSTSALVAMRRDRPGFAADLRRPVPVEPTTAAQRGSALHAWIEAQYGHVPLLDDADLGSGEGPDEDLAALQETFSTSVWARRAPSHIEVDVELPVAGVTVRSRIDAVFPPGAGLERVTVVDWKSGRPPLAAEEKAAREVQLAMYRLAWSERTGIPVEDIDAAFYYVATDQTVFPERLLAREQIVALIEGRDGDAAAGS